MGMHCGREDDDDGEEVSDFFVHVMTSWGALSSAFFVFKRRENRRVSHGLISVEKERPTTKGGFIPDGSRTKEVPRLRQRGGR